MNRTYFPNAQGQKSFVSNTTDVTQIPSQLFQSGFYQRLWLKQHGKEKYIPFSDSALMQLRHYFNSLDQSNKGSIGVEQLQDPFIAFGLSSSRQQVIDLIKSVDLDNSGQIEFDQFLGIMLKIKRGNKDTQSNSAMLDFFQKMSQGKLNKDYDENMSFKLNVSQLRRKKLLDSIMATDKQRKQEGLKIMSNFKKQIKSHANFVNMLENSKKSNVMANGFQSKKPILNNDRNEKKCC